MAKFIISTTGALSPVVFSDLGGRQFFHPTTSYDLTDEFTLTEISYSIDVQNSINNGWITVTDEFLRTITISSGVSITTLFDGTNINVSGNSFSPYVNVNQNISLSSITATILSGGTFFSGSTPLSTIIQNIATGSEDITRVQPGSNITTGGTGNNPIVSVADSPSFNNLNLSGLTTSTDGIISNTLSANTIFSGSTNLYSIFATIPDQNDVTRVQPGSNITTGGTATSPIINLIASPSIDGLTFSGTAIGNALSATTISATTVNILSSGLIIRNPANTFSNIFASSAIVANRTITIPLLTASDTLVTAAFIQTLTNKTLTSPVINTQITGTVTSGGTITATNYIIAANAVQTLSAKTINATTNTITDTSTSLGDLFKSNGTKFVRFARGSSLQHLRVNVGATDLEWADEDVTRAQPGSNITTGGTATSPIINVVASPSFNNLNLSGLTTSTDGIISNTLSANTIFSGSTNLYSIFATIPDQNDVTRVQPGSNITTGGTATSPIINLIASPSIDGLTFSGTAIGNALSATTLSGGTIYSGGTDLYAIFQAQTGVLKQKNGSVSGSTFSGNPKKATVTFTTAFADNNYAVTITGEIERTWTIESKTSAGFTINANANLAFTSNVFWMAGQIGESN